MPDSSLSAPSALDFMLKSRQERINSGVGEAYADTYNTAWQNDYQLALQEYLYNKYQSPAAMARQYEEAGINRNFASQSGGDVHSPQNNFKSNIQQSQAQRVQNVLGSVNAILGLINSGVNAVSDLTNLPKDLAFKEWRNVVAGIDANTAENKAMSSLMQAMYDQAYYGGVKFEPFEMNGTSFDISGSPAMQQAISRNALMALKVATADWDLNHLKPAQLNQINEMIENIAQRTSFLGLQEDLYLQLKSAGLLAPIIVSLLKFF